MLYYSLFIYLFIDFAQGCMLLQAAALGDIPRIQAQLLKNPHLAHFRDYDRRTALHVSASEGHLAVVQLLVERYRVPINRSDRWGGSPLDDAHRHRRLPVVQYLRSRGATNGSADHTTNFILPTGRVLKIQPWRWTIVARSNYFFVESVLSSKKQR